MRKYLQWKETINQNKESVVESSDALMKEQRIISELRSDGMRYNPIQRFSGSTECFVLECLSTETIKEEFTRSQDE